MLWFLRTPLNFIICQMIVSLLFGNPYHYVNNIAPPVRNPRYSSVALLINLFKLLLLIVIYY